MAAIDLLRKAVDILRGTVDEAGYKSIVLTLLYLHVVSSEFKQWDPPSERVRNPDQDPVAVLDEMIDAVRRTRRDFAEVFPSASALLRGLERRRITELFTILADSRGAAVYEDLLAEFARFEGRKGGDFHTPRSVARLLVEALQPQQGRVYDPCCGSGGMLVQAARFAAERGGDPAADLACYGQEINVQSWRLGRMNVDIQGQLPVELGCADTLARDLWPSLKADIVLANPPFNMSDWANRTSDPRWRYGTPPSANANFAWLQHTVDKLSDRGSAGVVLANGSVSSKQRGEGEIRTAMVEDDLIACIVALPAQLFNSTSIPACVWFLTKDKSSQGSRGLTDRRGQTLFIDARAMGELTGRSHRLLTAGELSEIAGAYRAWRGTGRREQEYKDVPGFCQTATLEEIRENQHILAPGRYVGAADVDRERGWGQPDDRLDVLTKELIELLDKSDHLTKRLRKHLDA
ncbi:N-6 DNA methylase [Streptomyces sp. NPDC002057]|uniref:N-6 DNA methylase n=1 Tax=Streptomyces sp. NPDC002057 TaxID=3154664 RepID=UPI00331C0E43